MLFYNLVYWFKKNSIEKIKLMALFHHRIPIHYYQNGGNFPHLHRHCHLVAIFYLHLKEILGPAPVIADTDCLSNIVFHLVHKLHATNQTMDWLFIYRKKVKTWWKETFTVNLSWLPQSFHFIQWCHMNNNAPKKSKEFKTFRNNDEMLPSAEDNDDLGNYARVLLPLSSCKVLGQGLLKILTAGKVEKKLKNTFCTLTNETVNVICNIHLKFKCGNQRLKLRLGIGDMIFLFKECL